MTVTALTRALDTSRALSRSSYADALRLKGAGLLSSFVPADGLSSLGGFRDQAVARGNFAAFRGWLYAAVNAIASEGAGQPAMVGRVAGKGKKKPGGRKAFNPRIPRVVRSKAAGEEVEVLLASPLNDLLERPNPIQGRWQFTYSFLANLCLTGWSYIVRGKGEDDETEMWSIPTTWITPDHEEGPFSRFFIQNPRNPSVQREELPADAVGFAHLPNPADPLSAIAPASAQAAAIRIDDHIQTSQSKFFENGIFPAAIVKIGTDPHPDVPAGIAPRLSAAQRRQVVTAIRKVMGGVANYGNPAIVDGLIGGIERLSATQNEMGWDKSEDKVRGRILSAFAVHPFILGHELVGSEAQARIIKERFYKRVNTYLSMLGQVVTALLAEDGTLVWWEELEAIDPATYWSNINQARNRDDISQNEMRALLNMPPDEDDAGATINPQAVGAIAGLLAHVGNQVVLPEQAAAVLVGMGIPEDMAEEIAGVGREFPEPEPAVPPGGPQAAPGTQPAAAGESKPKPAEEALDDAVKALDAAVAGLREGADVVAARIVEKASWESLPRVPAGSPEGGQWESGGAGGGGSGAESRTAARRLNPLKLPKEKPAPVEFAGRKEKPKPPDLKSEKVMAKLTDSEQAAIRKYTTNNGYKGFNKALRTCPEEQDCLSDAQKTQKAEIDSAFARAGTLEAPATLYRGVKMPLDKMNALVAHLQKSEGEEIAFDGITSLSANVDTAGAYSGGNGVIFRVSAKTGLPVESISKYPGEREVLHNHGTRYKVGKVTREAYDLVGPRIIIELKEI